MGANKDLLDRRAAITPRGVPRVTTATAASAHGATIVDAEGKELLDFAGGIGVMNAGHGQERVIRAIQEQAERLVHTCFHVATYEPYVRLCETLADVFPHGKETKVLLVNSGAEAVENAVKIARQATGRPAVICFTEAFHGRTLLGMTLTSKVGYKTGCGPFAPEVYRLPFPDYYKRNDGLNPAAFVARELHQLREALVSTVAAKQVAAIIVEIVQGEGGFVPLPREYVTGLREICDEHDIVLIFDEVQTGFCRTGRWAAYEHVGVTPDLSTWAKSMGGGLPIAAVIGKAAVMDGARPGTIGGTYGGNPVACAAALATIEVMKELDLNARAMEIGRQTMDRFNRIKAKCPLVGDVRGLGAMVAMEFVHDGDPNRPAAKVVKEILGTCLERGVLLLSSGLHGNVIRILSPLTISDEELRRGLDILEEEIFRCATAAPRAKTRKPVTAGR